MDNNTQSAQTQQVARPSLLGHMKSHIRDYGMLLTLVVIMALFEVLTDGTLMRPVNLTNLLLQNSYIIIMLSLIHI